MIGIFNDNYPPIIDGVAMTAHNYAYWLHQRQQKVCVVTPFSPNSGDMIIKQPFPILRYNSIPIPKRPPYRYGLPYTDWTFMNQLRMMPFDLVHAHCPFTSGHLALRIARKQQIPIVATFHSKYRQDFERAVKSKIIVDAAIKNLVHFYEQVDEVWIPQAAVEATIREYGYKGNLTVVENGNDFVTPEPQIMQMRHKMREKLSIADSEIVLLFVGQHIWEKGIGLTLDALYNIKHLPWHFFMIGTGYAVSEINKHINDLGLSNKISLVGNIFDRELLKQYYAAADIFLFPSMYDNAPLVVREAAALQTPTIMCAGSTASEVINNGINGWLTAPEIPSYAALISYLIEHPQEIRRVGQMASKTLTRSWENIVDEVIERYKDIQEKYRK